MAQQQQHQQSSRLNRLLTLLDTGSTSTTRLTAARQIGEIAKQHPTELQPLLKRVRQFLRSKSWETRVAAAQAIGAIAENVNHISVKEIISKARRDLHNLGFTMDVEDMLAGCSKSENQPAASLDFSRFDVQRVLEFGRLLLSSGGQEFDVAMDNTKSPAERLAHQKQTLRRRLGLDDFTDMNDMVHDEDLMTQKAPGSSANSVHGNHSYGRTEVQQLVAKMNMSRGNMPRALSAREKNMLKRKAKVSVKEGSKEDQDIEEPVAKRAKSVVMEQSDKLVLDSVLEDDGQDILMDGRWPFSRFVEVLMHDIFDPVWEIRHGSIMALREILSTHAGSAAVVSVIPENIPSSLVKTPSTDIPSPQKMSPENILSSAPEDVPAPDKMDTSEPVQDIPSKMEIDLNSDLTPLKEELMPEVKPEVKSEEVLPEVKAEVLPEVKPEVLSEVKPEVSPEVKPDVSPEVKSDVSPEVKPDVSPEVKSDVSPEVKPDVSPEVKPDVSPEVKPDVSPEVKPDVSPEVKPDVSPEVKPDVLLEAKPEVIPEVKQDVLSEVKPELTSQGAPSKLEDMLDLNQDIPGDHELTNGADKGAVLPSQFPDAAKIIRFAQDAWAANTEFLQDCTIRLLCVFALDRFGDFVSDQVVAPVRETCAQALGAVLKQMHPKLVHEVLNILLQMQRRAEWEVRHGSLLGIKYLIAVRQEMMSELLPRVLPACVAGLEDPDDDVRAVAADALVPAASAIVSHANHVVKTILSLLWDILLDLDDLSPSTSSVMHLLAELYSQPEAVLPSDSKLPFDLNFSEEQQQELEDLSVLAPRLWPFMRHNISSVRHAAIRTLERLLESGPSKWALPILNDMLRMVFQNLLMESNDDILQCSGRVWRLLVQSCSMDIQASTLTYFSKWLELASSAAGASLEYSSIFSPTSLPRGSRSKAVAKLRASKAIEQVQTAEAQKNSDRKVVIGADGENSIIHMRVATTTALGILSANIPASILGIVSESLRQAILSNSGIQRQVSSMVLITCFKEIHSCSDERKGPVVTNFRPLVTHFQGLLTATEPSHPTPGSNLPYAELSRTYAKMRAEVSTLIRHAESLKVPLMLDIPSVEDISIEAAVDVAMKLSNGDECDTTNTGDEMKSSAKDLMESARQRLLATAGYLKCVQVNLHSTVLALMAAVVVWMGELPSKLNPVIQPLMSAMKREQEEVLQQIAADALAEVIAHCVGRKPCPNDKLIKNLSTMVCADQLETPVANEANSILTLDDTELSKATVRKIEVTSADDRVKLEGVITRRGAELALKALCQRFDDLLFEKLPRLWDCLTDVIKPSDSSNLDGPFIVEPSADSQALVNNLQLIRVIAPFLKGAVQSKILTLLPAIFGCVRHRHALVRAGASRCITAMAKTMKDIIMTAVLSKAMPMLTDGTSMEARQGAGMLVTFLVEGLGAELVGYAPYLIVPLLGCMGDSNQLVRQSVTHSFAALVPLLPLARGVPQPPGISSPGSSEDAKFLEQLLDNSRVDDYKLAFELKTSLRRYQQEGINWLGFLKRFKLHGILCDDMGLGKTLQASAIVASDTAERIAANSNTTTLSLIVCPPTLVGHWVYEIEKFIPSEFLKPLQYIGQPNDRVQLRNQFSDYSIIITSYDVLRKDIDHLSQIAWNYCILDEGHVIKSGKSKITVAVKRIQAEHRLILTGTPIQNNVLELWSLFDFLMPGFLGTERQFHAIYGKPLLAARDPKCSAKEAEAGVLAMEALHKQVMPFLLRRTKDEVLADLPPKIIQDRYCDLCPLQLSLYERFSKSQAKKDVSNLVEAYGGDDSSKSSAPTHVFQALQYLRKVCSHPLLVLDANEDLCKEHGVTDLHDIQNSPKLLALRDILEECGIGISNGENSGQHRVLVFAQLKSFLDIIEKDLFQTHMKSVTYLRLDGSVETDKRFEIVKTFNADPTIDVLLLTTHVGGLGLNLTAADTVVFMEHDWNPMRDMQAMDRAHRLGQKRVVNVHRLIMRGTLEEKVMSLQRFKLSVANTVINSENASLNTMDTGQLLDLFTVSGKKANEPSTSKEDEEGSKKGEKKGLRAMLNSLEDLWDQSLYNEEYNLGQFVSRLK